MVFWAAHWAKRSSHGSQLGLGAVATVEWLGRRGMRWPALLPLLMEERKKSPPQILLIHLGGNDLGLMKGKALVIQARNDLAEIAARWPGVSVIFSALLPRKVWRGQGNLRCLDKARRKVNREMRKAMVGGLGTFLPHPDIRVELDHLYRPDGVHMSAARNDVFLGDLRLGLSGLLGC